MGNMGIAGIIVSTVIYNKEKRKANKFNEEIIILSEKRIENS